MFLIETYIFQVQIPSPRIIKLKKRKKKKKKKNLYNAKVPVSLILGQSSNCTQSKFGVIIVIVFSSNAMHLQR